MPAEQPLTCVVAQWDTFITAEVAADSSDNDAVVGAGFRQVHCRRHVDIADVDTGDVDRRWLCVIIFYDVTVSGTVLFP